MPRRVITWDKMYRFRRVKFTSGLYKGYQMAGYLVRDGHATFSNQMWPIMDAIGREDIEDAFLEDIDMLIDLGEVEKLWKGGNVYV